MTKCSFSADKAKEMLKNPPHQKPLSPSQKRLFGMVASGVIKCADSGAQLENYNSPTSIVPDERLSTLNLGSLAGTKKTKETEAYIKDMMTKDPNKPIAGGESANQFYDRIRDFALDIHNKFPKGTLITGHSTVVSLLHDMLKHGMPERYTPDDWKRYNNMEGKIKPGEYVSINGVKLLRHGPVDANSLNEYRTDDAMLNEEGIQKTNEVSKRLSKEDIPLIVSSPLPRTMITSEIIANGQKKKEEDGGWLEKYADGGRIYEEGGSIPKKEMSVGMKVEVEHKPTLEFIKKYFKENNKFPTLKQVAKSIVEDHENDFPKIKGDKPKSYYRGLVENKLTDEVDKYADGGYLGYTTEGRHYSPAWGGAWENGGSIPGSVGFSYARTGSTPSESKYAKKTLPSALNGRELQYYQQGNDWQPKMISANGANVQMKNQLVNLDQLTNFTNYNKQDKWLEHYK